MRILFIVYDWEIDILGIGYLSSALKKEGHEVGIVKSSKDSVIRKIEEYKPDMLGYSTTTGWHNYYLELNRELKSKYPHLISVFGGAHATYFPEVADEEGVDFIIRGEAEKTFPLLVDRFVQGWDTPVKVIEPAMLEQDLDNIEFPDRELLYSYQENRDNPIRNVITTRGCPFNCSYCFNSLYRSLYKGQRWVRYRSVENVVAECEGLKRYRLKLIFFEDDCFGFKIDWLKQFAALYSERIKVPFHCQVRIEMLNEDRVKLLKMAGCNGVTFAIESGNENIRKNILGRKYTNEQILDGANLLKRYKLRFRAENMCGVPGESINNLIETFELNKKCEGVYNWMSIFQPYPKLPLSEKCKEMGLWSGRIESVKKSFFEDSVLNIKNKMCYSNFQRIFALAVRFNLPGWIVKLLIRLPLRKVYRWLFKWYKNRQYKVLLRYDH